MILRVNNLYKAFGSVRAVDGVSFGIDHGEDFCIIGESASGKSTIARLLMGLLKPDAGEINLDRSTVQMVFQDPYSSLDPLWTVRLILKEALCRQNLSKERQNERFLKILQAVGLPGDVLNRFPHEFSGGERQRIAIARALLTNPKILILDEAVSSLDVLVQKQILELLLKIKQDFHLSYIFISHNLRVVRRFDGKIAVMRQGKFIEVNSSQNIFEKPQQAYTQQLLKAAFEYKI